MPRLDFQPVSDSVIAMILIWNESIVRWKGAEVEDDSDMLNELVTSALLYIMMIEIHPHFKKLLLRTNFRPKIHGFSNSYKPQCIYLLLNPNPTGK